jgi:hypothetical protein
MSSNGEQQQGYGSIEAPTITNFEQDHREHNFRQYHNGHPASLQSRSLLFVAVSALIVALYGAAVSFFPFSPTADDILAGTRSACSKGLWKTNSDMDNTKSRYYKHMHVDHDDITSKKTFTSRYFQRDTYWKGPGHPIFVILGGEDPLENLLYPFIYYHLAKQYGAVTIGIEHRFFGESWPIKHPTHNEMAKLLSPKQALEDAKQLIQYKRKELGCSPDRTSANYCPVMTIGGSYPGFLAALMRITYPDIVDIGYAASAPLHLYDHTAAPESYFDKLTAVADKASPGCADAARKTFQEMKEFTLQSSNLDKVAKQLGVCYKHEAIPKYIVDAAENGDLSVFLQELNIIIAAHFAEANMDYYPPGPETELEQWCSVFQQESSMPEKISKFLRMRPDFEICFDMQSELPPGPRARISASDWSGVGSGDPAVMWEFVSCQVSIYQSSRSIERTRNSTNHHTLTPILFYSLSPYVVDQMKACLSLANIPWTLSRTVVNPDSATLQTKTPLLISFILTMSRCKALPICCLQMA